MDGILEAEFLDDLSGVIGVGGLYEDFLLAFIQRLDLFVDAFNPLDKGANAIAWDSCRVCHACSLSKRHKRMQRK